VAALSSFRPSLAWFFFFFAFAQHSSHFVCLIRFTFLRRGTKYFLRSFFVLRYPFYIAYTHILVLDSHFIMHLLRRLGLPRFFFFGFSFGENLHYVCALLAALLASAAAAFATLRIYYKFLHTIYCLSCGACPARSSSKSVIIFWAIRLSHCNEGKALKSHKLRIRTCWKIPYIYMRSRIQ